ncbi:MAG TPA: OmpA family protein [Rhizomicrobium sp.]|nr:OmpA family protein [Rhizomicrobium sp.]
MVFSLGGLAGKLTRLGAVVAIAATLGACSVIPDWMGGDSGSSDSAPPPPDQATAAPADQTASTDTSQNGAFPDLADTPDRPAAPSTPDDQKKVADSLAAARAQQQYSADNLRAGQEQAAPPPGAPQPDEVAEVDTGSKGSSAASQSPDDNSSDTAPDNSAASDTAPDSGAAAPAPAPTTAVASAAAPPPTGGTPAVPASSVPGAQSIAMSDAALGFQPSKAPPLDASVAQFVPMPIMARYQQTASAGGAAGLSGSPYAGGPAVPAVPAAAPTRAVGGPETMSGAVVANFNSLQGAAVGPAVYANAQGLPPAAAIPFEGSTTILSADAKAQVKAAADSYTARGAGGYIRVVGHSAIASAKLSDARRLQINFENSQARATAVMRELVKDGVPADRVLIDAVGDNGTGSSSAEIFFQG